MRSGRAGGWLTLGGGAAVGIAILRYLTGGGVSFGSTNPSGLLILAALALFGSGATVLGVGGLPPLDGTLARVGLASLAVGQLSLLALSIVLAASSPESIPSLPVYPLDLLATVAAELGLVLIGVALVRLPGLPRLVGAVLLAGALALAGAAFASVILRLTLPGHTVLWALVLAIAGNVGIGLLAVLAAPVVGEDSNPS